MRETELDLDNLAQTESVFALSNGHIGLRGNLDEGEPFGLPGTYLAGFYELRPLPYAEAGYGYPEAGQTVVNVTNGKIMRLLVDDEPFDVRYGELRQPRARARPARRRAAAQRSSGVSPAGRAVRIASTRLVSFAQRAVAAILYEVEALDGKTPVVVQSELVANEALPGGEGDPRAAAALASPLVSEYFGDRDTRAVLAHSTRTSGLTMAAAMDHVIDGPAGTESSARELRGPRPSARDRRPGARQAPADRQVPRLRLVGASARGRRCAIRSRRRSGEARHTPAGTGCSPSSATTSTTSGSARTSRSRATPSSSRRCASGSSTCCRPAPAAEQRAIAAKGLTGPGYDGHTFWDTETFVLPVLTYTAPHAAADALRWRHRRSSSRRSARGRWACRARRSRGGRSAARSARATGRRAPPRSTSTPTSPTRSCATRRRATTTRRSSSGAGHRAAGRDGAAVALARAPRRRRALPHRRRHRPRRVQRDRRQQRLHQPDGPAQPARRRRRRPSAIPNARPSSASTRRRPPLGATRRRRC